MKALKIILLALIFIALQANANEERNLAVKQANNAVNEQRIALVIGNGAYTNSPLKNPVNDAKDMAKKLRGLGFIVIERSNLQTRQIGATLREFRSKLVPGAVALVFYAGHGLQIKGDNYLPAVDADINSEEDVPNQSLAVKQIMDVLDESKTRLNLVFLDACRNNPYARSFRSSDKGLARVSAPSGTLISYATKPGSVAADGDGRNGLYTSKLLAQMDSTVQIEQALKRVVTAVKAASQGKQEPWMEGSIEGDFCFGGCITGDGTQVASLVPVPAHVKSKDEIEQEAWEGARDSRSEAGVQEYLKQYHKGRYVAQAKILIATLKAEAAKPATIPAPSAHAPPKAGQDETELWTYTQMGNSKEDYLTYLDQYPNGKFALLAKARIKKLQDDAQAAVEQKEQQAWDTAQDGNSKASYARYLKVFPNGKYAELAKENLEGALWKKAEADEKGQAVQAYLDKYPNGSHVTAAQEKLVAIKKAEEMRPGKVFRDCPDCPEMVILPKPFAMGKTEVTQGQWKAVMGNNPSHFSNCGDTCPVESVSWNDAQEFISKLNAKTGKQYRLPTEAEWEYACYGGGQSEYCGGDNIDAVAWYKDNSGGQTHPVGQKQANGYGLYDMSGNVWEWMENKYDNEHDWRAVRGGSWIIKAQFTRAANRINDDPARRSINIGFRLARTLP